MNRVGDFGMIIGLMALWGALGTFNFGDYEGTTADGKTETRPGLFNMVRPGEDRALIVPDGMVIAAAADRITAGETVEANLETWRKENLGYGLLIVAGLGIFCGCVGKSAQFPLHVWLPDAMEGPTPVSALVHSATMVAAGVYLVGRFYPVFTPEVLLTIAYIGGITLFIAATIAITATDIKRVLAYSTVSQLGYMMLALGLGGWLAGVFHLITHAFFKSLLFMCSGSVIHACHTNDMTKMGAQYDYADRNASRSDARGDLLDARKTQRQTGSQITVDKARTENDATLIGIRQKNDEAMARLPKPASGGEGIGAVAAARAASARGGTASEPAPSKAPTAQKKTVTAAQINELAKAKGISVADARKFATENGYVLGK